METSTVLAKKAYEKELSRLHIELVKLQNWVKANSLKVLIIFEGRDAAGKGGAIKTLTEPLNPRSCRVIALPKPTERERTQWYFQRYAAHLPAAGEIVIFDRSWYNRAGVEKVMGYCTEDEYERFLEQCPMFEKLLVDAGIILIKYWFSVSMEEQRRRIKARNDDPTKRWKISPVDLEASTRWEDYSKAKDNMQKYTDTSYAPWYIVESDIKNHARINCISHLLSKFDYEDLTPEPFTLAEIECVNDYTRAPYDSQHFVPDVATALAQGINE